MWYEMTNQSGSNSLGQSADVHVAPSSPWFRGHFPDRPVLPGIAQLSMVFDLIRQGFNQPVSLTQISRVRFKQLILPDDRITIKVEPRAGKEGAYAFRIFKEDELISNGTLKVKGRTAISNAPDK